jgi:sec-independent protein translocase protein TatA
MIPRVLRLSQWRASERALPGRGTVMGRIGGGELLLIALIALLVFGAGRLSDIGKGLGEGIKNFKKGLKDDPAAPGDSKQMDVKPGEKKA